MATIKIDRGFTQKIQQKGVSHPPSMEAPSLHPKKPQKPAAGKRGVSVACVSGGVIAVVAVAVLAGVFLRKGGANPKQAQPAAPAPVARPAEKTVAASPALEPAALPADREAEPQAAQPPSASGQPPQTLSAAPAPLQPVWRDLPLGGQQGLRCDYYENIPGKPVSALRADDAFPNRPKRTVQIKTFELSQDIANNYGVRVRGYLVPSASGKYGFSACADDGAELWLSTDDSPARLRKLISFEPCVPKGQWTLRKDQQSPECELVAGQRYYLEAFLKENTGSDYLSVAWKGPVSDRFVVIEGRFLQPWTEATGAAPAASEADRQAKPRKAREAAEAPARAAVEEQRLKHASAYRYARAAEVLKSGKAAWREPQAQAVIEDAILRFELLERLRAFVQGELAKAPVRAVWTAFGGQADVTAADDEGLTVAPGRIVAWPQVPPDQMLRLVNATVPRLIAEPNGKGVLSLASAVFCKEVSGGLDLALKYRERAIAQQSSLAALSERVLGGTPETLQAEVEMHALRAELDRSTATAAGLAEKAVKQRSELAAVTGLVPGVLAEYWENNAPGSLNDSRNKGVLKNPPDSTQALAKFETPQDRANKYTARVRGFLTPPENGQYFFYLAADDYGELWLSTDETPEKLALIIKTDSWIKHCVWDREKRRSKAVQLTKGQHYLIEGLLKENEGNDHLCVAWSPDQADAPELITSAHLQYAATAGFTPRAQEIRQQVEADLAKVLKLLSEVSSARDSDQAWLDADEPATRGAADTLKRQVRWAQEALREADAQMRQTDDALSKLRAASRPDGSQS